MAECTTDKKAYFRENELDVNEVYFLQAMSLIASRFGCTITNIDYTNKVIEMEGPEDSQYNAAIAMTEYQNMIDC